MTQEIRMQHVDTTRQTLPTGRSAPGRLSPWRQSSGLKKDWGLNPKPALHSSAGQIWRFGVTHVLARLKSSACTVGIQCGNHCLRADWHWENIHHGGRSARRQSRHHSEVDRRRLCDNRRRSFTACKVSSPCFVSSNIQ